MARWGESLSHRVYLALAAAALLPLGLAFGLVPPALVVRVPFLRNISHLHNTFSAVLLVLVIVMAGVELAEWWKNASEARGRVVLVAAHRDSWTPAGSSAIWIGTRS